MGILETEFPWVIFHLEEGVYGLSCQHVESMVILKDVTQMPKSPREVRGVINLRDKVIACIDLRRAMGFKSIDDEVVEFEEMMTHRQEDHIRWLEELESSVREHRSFALTTSPHECAFGKWYDSFTTQDVILRGLLRRFDEPHRTIHSIAKEVEKLEKAGEFQEAFRRIEKTRGGALQEMIRLFTSIKVSFRESKREIVIVLGLGRGKQSVGIIVDEVISVEPLADGGQELLDERAIQTKLAVGVGRRRRENSLVILLEEEKLLDHVGFQA